MLYNLTMKIAIIGAGFTGLSAAYYLQKAGHSTVVYEKCSYLGGLAGGIKHMEDEAPTDWEWDLEHFYHHWFTNDNFVFELGKEIGVADKFITKRPRTDILYNDRTFPFDSPFSLLKFPYLSWIEKFRTGLLLAQLKYQINEQQSVKFENVTAYDYLKKHSGKEAFAKIWEPLLIGKFAEHYKEANMRWFWARIFKRTPSLSYYEGGFAAFAQDLANEITQQNGTVLLQTTIKNISPGNDGQITVTSDREGQQVDQTFDRVIVTTPPQTLPTLVDNLPKEYIKKLKTQDGIGAQVLVIALHHPVLIDTYWLSINATDWPFLALVEHTNFMDKSHYNDEYIIYIGDYLDKSHPNMHKSKEELIELYTPYIKRICPLFSEESIIRSFIFRTDYAQPIPKVGHQNNILPLQTPIKNLYLASMAQVYPWDRGTNYAIEMGKKVSEIILR